MCLHVVGLVTASQSRWVQMVTLMLKTCLKRPSWMLKKLRSFINEGAGVDQLLGPMPMNHPAGLTGTYCYSVFASELTFL